jgi:hypothetical protein
MTRARMQLNAFASGKSYGKPERVNEIVAEAGGSNDVLAVWVASQEEEIFDLKCKLTAAQRAKEFGFGMTLYSNYVNVTVVPNRLGEAMVKLTGVSTGTRPGARRGAVALDMSMETAGEMLRALSAVVADRS